MPRRTDNLYRTHGEGTTFLDKHLLPNSVIVNATQNRAKSHSASAPSNMENRKLDLIGRHHYSLASFALRNSNYLCAIRPVHSTQSFHQVLRIGRCLSSSPWRERFPILRQLASCGTYKTSGTKRHRLHPAAVPLWKKKQRQRQQGVKRKVQGKDWDPPPYASVGCSPCSGYKLLLS
ncbi:hypothetical protein JRQ81_002330 [Phrynocephalus forsythii]|uniref:Uncharacterized protein n=1 Tax=Phrynocephalus forsythii TaxID=171643 RepID=A0A9Q1AWK6_9SAUR|nr:hypothetical protein JRQ81_002330 [Phrynocephalus forsythii]